MASIETSPEDIRNGGIGPVTKFLCGILSSIVIISFFAPRFLGIGPGIIGLFTFVAFYLSERECPPISKPAVFWAILIPVMAAVSAVWAVDPDIVWERMAKMSLIFLPGVLLLSVSEGIPKKFVSSGAVWISVAVVFLGGAIATELLFDMPIYKTIHGLDQSQQGREFLLNRSTAAFVLLLLPSIFMVNYNVGRLGQLVMFSVYTVVLLSILSLSFSQSAQLAVIIGTLFFFAFPYRLKGAWHVLAGLIVFFIFMSPWIASVLYQNLISVAESSAWLSSGAAPQRLEIWHFVSQKIMESPVYGFGVEATRSITFDTDKLYYPSNTVLHPHNFALQVWIEFGVVGAAMASAFCVHMLHIIRTSFTVQQARYVLPVFMGALSLASTGYGLWQGWLLGLFVLTMALVLIAVKSCNSVVEH